MGGGDGLSCDNAMAMHFISYVRLAFYCITSH